jgi:hypothetical protein
MHHPMPVDSTAALSLRIAGARLAHSARDFSALGVAVFWAGWHEPKHGA